MNYYSISTKLLLIGGLFLTFTTLWAQDFDVLQKDDVFATFEAVLDPQKVRKGEHVRVVISSTIKEGWHIYSVIPSIDEFAPPPTKVEWESLLIPKGPIYESNPIIDNDPVLGMVLAYHKKYSRFYQNFQIPEEMALGSYQLNGVVQYQTCSNKICLPPKKAKLSVPFQVEDGPVRPAYAYMNRVIDEIPPDGSIRPTSESIDSALSGGFWAFIGLAIIMGMLAWLTPCVFPMIPITVSFFSKQNQSSYRRTLGMALTFSLGIVITYTGTGLILSGILGAAGAVQLATNPWINLAVAGLFMVFAFSLMGLFELKIPSRWTQRVDQASRHFNGVFGMTLMGMTFTLTAFTCTVQFVGTLLVAAAQGEWMWPIIGMLVFSSVFAFPFFLLALFPRLVQTFQSKSGAWLVQVKMILGLVELMAVFKFLSNADLVWGLGIIDRTVVLGAWTLLVIGMILVIFGKFPFFGMKKTHIRVPHFLTITPLFALAIYFGSGTIGQSLDSWTESYLPLDLKHQQAAFKLASNRTKQAIESIHDLPWHNNLQTALDIAKQEQKPVFIDFTGYTCVNCRWMEKNVFADPSVYQLFKDKFVLVQLYTDGGEGYEENLQLQIDRFKTIALPFYVILSSDNAVLAKQAGISSSKEFIKWLQDAQMGFQKMQ